MKIGDGKLVVRVLIYVSSMQLRLYFQNCLRFESMFAAAQQHKTSVKEMRLLSLTRLEDVCTMHKRLIVRTFNVVTARGIPTGPGDFR